MLCNLGPFLRVDKQLAYARYTTSPFDTADRNRCPIPGWLLLTVQSVFDDRKFCYTVLDPFSGKTNNVLKLWDGPSKVLLNPDSTVPGRRTGGAS